MLKYVEGYMILLIIVLFSILSTVFMWITWLDRFSGNANFFYFQTIVLNVPLIIVFIQVFKAVNEKVKKY